MDTQRQCPNCGGYKISVSKTSNPVTLGESRTPELRALQRRNTFIFGPLLILAVASFVIASNNAQVRGPFILIGVMGVISIILSIVYFSASKTGKARATVDEAFRLMQEENARRPITYHYSCQICGFSWNWEVHQPYPYPPGSISPNRQLLQEGAQQLEEQKRRRAAAADYEQQRRRQQNR